MIVGAVLAALASGCAPAPPQPTAPTAVATSGFLPADNAQLHYELSLPVGTGPFPAVVFGHGSGPATKTDGIVHEPFWIARGFAVLRYDKRGAGQSTGTYRGVGVRNSPTQILELADDMAAAVRFLRARADINGALIGLMGVSQAGWVMVAATTRVSGLRFVVAPVGSVLPVGANVAYENQRDAPIDAAYAALEQYSGPAGYDPRPTLAASDVPVLYLLGAEDRLVPTRVGRVVIEALAAANAPVEAVVYAGVGHELGASTRVWPDIASWLQRRGLPSAATASLSRVDSARTSCRDTARGSSPRRRGAAVRLDGPSGYAWPVVVCLPPHELRHPGPS